MNEFYELTFYFNKFFYANVPENVFVWSLRNEWSYLLKIKYRKRVKRIQPYW